MQRSQQESVVVSDATRVPCSSKFEVDKYSVEWKVARDVSSESKNVRSSSFFIGKVKACIDLWCVRENWNTRTSRGREVTNLWKIFLQMYPGSDSLPRGKFAVTSIILKNSYREAEEKIKSYNDKSAGYYTILLEPNTYTQDRGWALNYELEFINHIDMEFKCDIWLVAVDKRQPPPSLYLLALSRDYLKLLNDGDYSDVTLKVGGEVLKAHKNILASRSPVFAAMLKADMAESRSGEIVIQDIEVAVMKMLLSFIYSGRVKEDDEPLDEDTAMKLLRAADKYDVSDLKTMCSEALARTMTVENVSHLLDFAIQHNADKLKSQSMHYIRSNMRKVSETTGWQQLKKSNCEVAMELLESCQVNLSELL